MPKHLLLLEDEPLLGELYAKELTRSGYQVSYCENVEELGQLVNEETLIPPAFILLDHGLREEMTTGLNLVPVLRERFPEAKICMLSNYSHGQIKEQAEEMGADAFFIKSTTPPHALPLRLEQLLREKEHKD